MFVLAAVRWELFGGRGRQEGMGRIGVLLVFVALLAAGCHGGPTESDAGGKSPETTDEEKRMIDVYAAIIRQLVTKDHTFGSGRSPFERVYVLDGVAADSDAVRSQAAEPFSPAVRAGILEKLRDLPPVEFVSDPGSVVAGEKRCAHVIGDGALITLHRITGGAEKVSVRSQLFFACLGGLSLTYLLEPDEKGWRVTGTKGPSVIL
jgi:hypothetical protein